MQYLRGKLGIEKKRMVDCVSVMPDILGSQELLTESDMDSLCDHE